MGREAELAQLQELLSASRLVTLIGIGGVGKTTLAAHAAAELRPQFSDGVWWVELAELREGALLTEVVAAALGVRDQMGRALSDVLVDFLAQRQTLLVLDNCEHLIDDVAKLAELLLRDCPQLQILATSREVLDIEGEAVLRLAPLSCPALDDDPTLRTLAGYEAVQLFVQRARAAVPGFELDAHNATAIARCCARLEGLPLAIELAAARMRAMSAEQIAERALRPLRLALPRAAAAPSTRRQSLAACVEWSYELCTQSEQRLWCRLSVLAESFDLPTARGICGDDVPAHEFLDLLCALVDKSILIRTEHHGVVRFRLLETLRDYGKSRLTDTEHTALGPTPRPLVSPAAHRRRGRMVWPPTTALDPAPDPRNAQHPRGAAIQPDRLPSNGGGHDRRPAPVLGAPRMLSEGCQWANRALAALSPDPSVQRIRALFTAAQLGLRHGDPVTAASGSLRRATLLEVVDDPVTCGRIDFLDGYTAMLAGDLDHARDCLQRAMAATDDFEVQANSMSAMRCWTCFLATPAVRWPGLKKVSLWPNPAVTGRCEHLQWVRLARLTGGWGPAARRTAVPAGLSTFPSSQRQVRPRKWPGSLGMDHRIPHQPRQAVVLMAAAAEISPRQRGPALLWASSGDSTPNVNVAYVSSSVRKNSRRPGTKAPP